MRLVILVGLVACQFHPRALTGPASDGDVTDTVPDAFACPAGYAMLVGGASGSLYRVYGDLASATPDRGTWLHAEAACQADGPGTHLAIAETEAEHQAFVDVVSGASRWLGVTDRKTEGIWLPITGEPESAWVPHWYNGVPSTNTTNNCLLLTRVSGLEEDTPCNGEGSPPSSQWDKGYICECDGRPVDPTTF